MNRMILPWGRRAMRPGAQGEREIDNNVKYYKLYLQLTRLSIISTG